MRRLLHQKALINTWLRLPGCSSSLCLCSCRRFCTRDFFRTVPLASLIRQLGEMLPQTLFLSMEKDLGVNKGHRGAWALLDGARGLVLRCCAPRNGESSALLITVVAARSCRGVLRCGSALGESQSVAKGWHREGAEGTWAAALLQTPPVQQKGPILMVPSSCWCSPGPRCTTWAVVRGRRRQLTCTQLFPAHSQRWGVGADLGAETLYFSKGVLQKFLCTYVMPQPLGQQGFVLPQHSPSTQACFGCCSLHLLPVSSAAARQAVRTPAAVLTRTGQRSLEAGSWFYSSALLET